LPAPEPTDTGAADTGDADTGDADTGDGDAHVRAGEDFRSFGKGEDVCDRLYRAARELEARRKARRVEANAEEAASVISPQLTQMALQLKRRDSLALKAAKRDSLPGGTGLEAEVATNGARLPAPVSAGERLYAQGERRRRAAIQANKATSEIRWSLKSRSASLPRARGRRWSQDGAYTKQARESIKLNPIFGGDGGGPTDEYAIGEARQARKTAIAALRQSLGESTRVGTSPGGEGKATLRCELLWIDAQARTFKRNLNRAASELEVAREVPQVELARLRRLTVAAAGSPASGTDIGTAAGGKASAVAESEACARLYEAGRQLRLRQVLAIESKHAAETQEARILAARGKLVWKTPTKPAHETNFESPPTEKAVTGSQAAPGSQAVSGSPPDSGSPPFTRTSAVTGSQSVSGSSAVTGSPAAAETAAFHWPPPPKAMAVSLSVLAGLMSKHSPPKCFFSLFISLVSFSLRLVLVSCVCVCLCVCLLGIFKRFLQLNS